MATRQEIKNIELPVVRAGSILPWSTCRSTTVVSENAIHPRYPVVTRFRRKSQSYLGYLAIFRLFT